MLVLRYGLLIASLLGAVAFASAQSSTQTASGTFVSGLSPFLGNGAMVTDTASGTATFNRFNPALGTLMSITLEVLQNAGATYSGTLLAQPSIAAGVNCNMTQSLTAFPPGTSSVVSTSTFFNQTATITSPNTAVNISYGAQSSSSGPVTLPASVTATFAGAGTINVPFTLEFVQESFSSQDPSIGAFATNTTFTINLVYNFIPATLTFGASIPAPLAIPDASVQCVGGPLLTIPIVVPSGAPSAADIGLSIGMSHTWYGDLKVRITNPIGQSAVVLIPACEGSIDDSSNLNGIYTFFDAATMGLDAAAQAAPTSTSIIPAGNYDSESPLMPLILCPIAGTWLIEFQDFVPGDVGQVSSLSLSFVPGQPTLFPQPFFTVSQCGTNAPLQIIHRGGAPFGYYANPVVIGGGATNGWFFGLDISIVDLASQLMIIPTVFGALDAVGGSTVTFPVVPPGLTISIVGVQFDASGLPTYASGAFDYTTI